MNIEQIDQDGENRTGRRRVLELLGGVGSVTLAGCLGSNEDTPEDDEATDESDDADNDGTESDENGREDDGEGEESEPAEAEDSEEEDDTESEQTGSEDDTEDGENATDEAQGIRPSDLDLTPDDAWDDDHPDVEIPDEPERAVLVVDGMRVEMTGDLTGGPNQPLYETVTDDDEFSGDGSYFVGVGQFSPTEESLAEHGWETGHQIRFSRRMVGWSGNSFSYVHADEFQLYWPNITATAQYRYREDPDGPTEDGGLPGMNHSDEPFLRIDRSGVVTAVGTITDPGNSDIPEGATFEFGARAQERWAERWEED